MAGIALALSVALSPAMGVGASRARLARKGIQTMHRRVLTIVLMFVLVLVAASGAYAVHIAPGQVFPPVTNDTVILFNSVGHDIEVLGPGESFVNRTVNSFNLLNAGDAAGACAELNSLIKKAEHEFLKGTIDLAELTRVITGANLLKGEVNNLFPGSCPP